MTADQTTRMTAAEAVDFLNVWGEAELKKATTPSNPTTEPTAYFSETRSGDLVVRGEVMWLIERALGRWQDSDPPRHALSVLWGEVRDMKDFETAERERMDDAQYRSTLSA